jgi:ABC-type transport system involved in multi-copper enzyme maturation permease subunit
MKWLIWKDYRVNRLVFITALVLLVVPHALFAILIWCRMGPEHHNLNVFSESSICSLALLQLVLALLGGNSIAGERIDRSAEFLAYLPVSRGRILRSKLLMVLAAVPLVWLPNLIVLTIAFTSGSRRPPVELYRWLSTIAITGLTLFCVAWLFSCILDSPTFSVCAGLIVPLLLAIAVLWVRDRTGGHTADELFLGWYWGLCLAISAASFMAGTLYYLRRIEP